MSQRFYTIGMAGHIDHGKTTLTKTLTNIDTDRLKEEKLRKISIEAGYAPLKINEDIAISVVDVPGHERFIRQMIAGVAGIDLVILVIAADEGVMPQTKEHLDILSFLGIKRGVIAITKIDRVEDELLELAGEEIREQVEGTAFEKSEIVFVDSLSHKGIDELKDTILKNLQDLDMRDSAGEFRLPIDHVFSMQGKGTIVRGTIYEGQVQQGETLKILPSGTTVKARQIQSHNQEQALARAGQRAAINIGGVSKNEVTRGDVLVSSNHFIVTETIDVAIRFTNSLKSPVKQRGSVKIHIGTSEVMGKIVFFDRNEVVDEPKEVLCQIRLDEQIITKRGDRFIIRRPTPVETIGGGWVIDPKGEKYRFAQETIDHLARKKEGTPEERVADLLRVEKLTSFADLLTQSSLDRDELQSILDNQALFVQLPKGEYARLEDYQGIEQLLTERLSTYHSDFPMRLGMNKPELIKSLSYPTRLVEFVLETSVQKKTMKKLEQFVAMAEFTPHFTDQWKKRMEGAVDALMQDQLQVKSWSDYTEGQKLPKSEEEELKLYLLQTNQAFSLDDKHLIHITSFQNAIRQLAEATGETFTLADAKDQLGVSRKYLIPIMELLDQYQITKRINGDRKWIDKSLGRLPNVKSS